jgi:catechol 2,3-dioxygenase-like lactoylglutathione lyase family enzyme
MAPDGVKFEMQEDVTQTVPAIPNHIHYIIGDPPAIQEWYVSKLLFHPRKRGAYESADVPGESLTFQKPKTGDLPKTPMKGRALDHVAFEVKNLREFCDRLAAQGVKFDIPYAQHPELGFANAFLTDPVGAYIELTEGLTF